MAARNSKLSAGTLLYRHAPEGLEVLLVHPSGAFNRKAAWGLPKGKPDPGETLETAARRETLEEAGVVAPEKLVPLGSVTYTHSRKTVHAFAAEVPTTVTAAPTSWEVDRAEFVPLPVARKRIHSDQATFLDRLERLLDPVAERTAEGDAG